MNTKNLIPLALCALLAACTSSGTQNQQSTADTARQAVATEQPAADTTKPQQPAAEPKQDAPKVDIAQNVLKLIDKKLLELDKNEFSITTADYNKAINEKRTFDEYTSPLFIYLMHQSDCFYIANVKCYKMDEGDKYFVFFQTDAGCDGGATVLTRCFTYADNQLTPTDNPITIPAFDEYFKGVNTAQFKDELKWTKQDYPKPNKDLHGIDIRFDDNGNIELRPASTEMSEELWEAMKPVKYHFDGKTLVKM